MKYLSLKSRLLLKERLLSSLSTFVRCSRAISDWSEKIRNSSRTSMKIVHSRYFGPSTEKGGKLARSYSELSESYPKLGILKWIFTMPILLVKQSYLTWEIVIIRHREY